MVLEFSSGGVMFARYKMFLLRHFCFKEHSDLLMELQVLLLMVYDKCSIFLLREFIIDFIFGKELRLIFTLFRLNSSCNLFCSGKCLSINVRKNLPSFVVIFLLIFFAYTVAYFLFSGPVSGILTCFCSLLLLVLLDVWG